MTPAEPRSHEMCPECGALLLEGGRHLPLEMAEAAEPRKAAASDDVEVVKTALRHPGRFIDFDYETGVTPRPMYVTANGVRQEMPYRLRAEANALRAILQGAVNLDAALAKTPAPRAPDEGTLTNCPLDGIHEHVFRGPHTFREWEPGTTPDDVAGSGERLALDEERALYDEWFGRRGPHRGAKNAIRRLFDTLIAERRQHEVGLRDHISVVQSIPEHATPTTEGPRAPVGELDMETLVRAMERAMAAVDDEWTIPEFADITAAEYAALRATVTP